MSAQTPLDEKHFDSDYKGTPVQHNEFTSADVDAALNVFKYDLKAMTPAEAARAADEIQAVRNAAYAHAIKASPIDWRSSSSRMLFFTCFVTFLGACTNGYDGSLFSGISPMIQYQDYFDIGTTGNKVSLVFSMYTVGSLIGPFFAGPIADRFGRRVGMFVGGLVILVGCVTVTAARGLNEIIAGRFVLGFGIAIMTVGAPTLCVEIAPPHWRGKFVGTYNCGWFGGSIPAAAITFGCNYIQSTWSFRIPFLMQGVFGLAVMCLVWFIPESPRWMMQNGKSEEALAWLIKYHGNGNPDSAIVKLEFEEFQQNIALDGSDKRWWDYRALFRTKNSRWRFLMVMMISVFGQFSGNGLGYFQNVIYNNLGYTSPQTVLGLNLAGSFLSAACGLTAASLSDRLPRIKTLTFGTLGHRLCLLGNGLSSTFWARQAKDAAGNYINPNLKIGQIGVAFNFLFGAVYSFSYTPLQGVYPTENLETTARAKGMALSGVLVSLIGFINTYAGPIALENMGNNYIYVFVGWDLVEAAAWWFLGVETQGRTLEELDEIYNQSYPPFASKKFTKVAVKSDGEILAVVDDNAA